MYAGENQGLQVDYTPFTGLDTFKVVAVNPTTEQLKVLYGKDDLNPVNYDLGQDLNGDSVRPLVIYVKGIESGVLQQLRLNIGNKPAVSKSGNYQVITSTGQVVWAKASGAVDVKPEFTNHRGLVAGESDLITFVQKCVNFSTQSGEDFMAQMQGLKQDAASVYAGDYSGMQKLVDWMAANNKTVVLALTVKEVEVDGVKKDRQRVAYKRNNLNKMMWHGVVNDYCKTRLQSTITADPELITNFVTVELMRFDKSKCLNNVPANPTGTFDWGTK